MVNGITEITQPQNAVNFRYSVNKVKKGLISYVSQKYMSNRTNSVVMFIEGEKMTTY